MRVRHELQARHLLEVCVHFEHEGGHQCVGYRHLFRWKGFGIDDSACDCENVHGFSACDDCSVWYSDIIHGLWYIVLYCDVSIPDVVQRVVLS